MAGIAPKMRGKWPATPGKVCYAWLVEFGFHTIGVQPRMAETAQELNEQVALITGAGRGIGRAIALAYARAGAAVGCVARSTEDIAATVRDIVAHGGRAIAVPADVTQLASVQQMLHTTVEAFGGLDILV